MYHEKSDELRRLWVPGVMVEFRWTGGRWVHSVHAGGTRAVVASSIDLDADKQDPTRVVSPTYQELHVKGPVEDPQLLLVGKSGRHHFSAVVSMASREGKVVLEFDVADRCRAPMVGLAATYRVDRQAGDLREADTSRVAWDKGGTLLLEAIGRATLVLAEAGRAAMRVQVNAPLGNVDPTHRLAYRWAWVP
jgi:hypothetical protein